MQVAHSLSNGRKMLVSLQGMFWEASGMADKAAELYKEFLKERPNDEIVSKRLVRYLNTLLNPCLASDTALLTRQPLKVAVEKTRGNTQAAAEALKKYLDVFSGDRDAWEELAELYIEVRNRMCGGRLNSKFDESLELSVGSCSLSRAAAFDVQAGLVLLRGAAHVPTRQPALVGESSRSVSWTVSVFWFVSLVTADIFISPLQVRYADVLYTQGHYRHARSYFAKAIEVSAGKNARALFGVLACHANITEKVGQFSSSLHLVS